MLLDNLEQYLDEVERLITNEGKADIALNRLMAIFTQARGHLRVAWLTGQALYALERYEEAEKFLEHILAVTAEPPLFLVRGLMSVYYHREKYKNASSLGERFDHIICDDIVCLFFLARSLMFEKDFLSARKIYKKLLNCFYGYGDIDPGKKKVVLEVLHNYSSCLVVGGYVEDAVCVFSKKIDLFMESSDSSNATDCNDISNNYDGNGLHDWIPKRLLSEYNKICEGRHIGAILDLGCGTGLLSNFLTNPTRLVGIDLSSGMLAKARSRGRYDNLIEGDLVSEMDKLDDQFDTIFSSGVLYHVEDLKPVFLNVTRLLNPGGIFAFSTDPDIDDHEVRSTGPGEYAHSRRYLRRLAAETGLIERRITIDLHRGTPGFWCVFEKPMD